MSEEKKKPAVRKKQNASARREFRNFWGTPRKSLGKRTLNLTLTAVERGIQESGRHIPAHYRGDPVVNLVMHRLVETAVRDNSEYPLVYCPTCRKRHHVNATAKCPVHCKEHHPELPVAGIDANGEKNSILAGTKIMDKVFPNLQNVNQRIEINETITTVSAELVKIVIDFVPDQDKRRECFQKMQELLAHAQATRTD